MVARHARLYDAIALVTIIMIIAVDQWTKQLVVDHLSPPGSHAPIQVIGQYLSIDYITNNGAAFSILRTNSFLLALLIALAVGVVIYLYIRIINSGPMFYKIVFGMIIGGALGNLIDRIRYAGHVVDFIYFQIPQINFNFAIFNVADACISVGVFLLFVTILFGGLRKETSATDQNEQEQAQTRNTLQATEQDAQH